MISFKKIVKSIVTIILFILTLAVFFNFFHVKRVVSEFDVINKHIKELNSIYIEMQLSIRVFKNISSQITPAIEKDQERKKRIINAYTDNRKKFIDQTGEMAKGSRLVSISLRKYSSNLFLQQIIPSRELELNNSRLSKNIDNLSKITELYLNENPVISAENVTLIDKSYALINKDLQDINSSYGSISKLMIDKYVFSINLLFFILLAIVIILTLILFRIMNKDLKYILQGFNMMNVHDYDVSNLPEMETTFLEEKEIKNLVTNVLEEQNFLNEVKSVTSSGYIIDDILEDLFYSIQSTLKTDRVGIAFIDYHHKKIIAEHGISNYGAIELGPGFEVNIDSTTLKALIESKKPVINNDFDSLLKQRPDSVSLKLLRSEGIQSNMIFPLIMNHSVFAFLFFSSLNKNNYNDKDLQIGQNIAHEIAALLDKTYLTKTIFSKITNTFSNLVDKKDNETGGHINRMVLYSSLLAKALLSHPDEAYKVDSRFVRDVENNASVHDIGKVGIPDEILKKPGKLTPEEREIMKTHSTIGGDIFAELKESMQIFNRDFYKISEDIARHHHEKWDGSGYPCGLKGSEIPLSARIVAIADVFDALTSKRVYKSAFGFEESVEIMNQSAGSHFDPELIRVFNENIHEFKRIFEQSH